MKSFARLALVLSALGLAVPAAAQQQARRQFGIGVSVMPTDALLGIAPTVEVYVPIRIAPQFRLEPSLGIFTVDNPAPQTDYRDFTVGLGAFFVKQVAAPADMYVGGRLKLNFAKAENAAASESDTDLLIAAALGGEYYLVPQFSAGLEAQLGLYQRGTVNGDDSGWFTNGLAFLRFYF